MPLTGRYINLDRSPARAAFMEAQLARVGLRGVTRLAAVDGAQLPPAPQGSGLLPGERACFQSHLRVLQEAAPDDFTLVLEDDVELADQLPEVLAKLTAGALAAADVAFLECQPHFTPAHLDRLWEAASRLLAPDGSRRTRGVDLLDAAQFFKWGTNAYLVTPAGRAKLLALLPAWLREGPVLPLDRCVERALVRGELRGVLLVPFLATLAPQWHGRSDIGNGWRQPPDHLMLLRRVFFAGSLAPADALAGRLARRPVDPALEMYALALREIAAQQRELARR